MPMNTAYRGPEAVPDVIPVFPLPGALLLPRGQMPLNIFEPRYLAMIDDALRSGQRLIGMIQPDPAHPGADPDKPHLFQVGCVGRMTQFAESGDGRYLIQLTGFAEIATRILGRPVRIGRPLGFGRLPSEAKSASFAAPTGLLVYPQYAHLEHVEPRHTRQLRTGTDGYFGKVGRWLREGF